MTSGVNVSNPVLSKCNDKALRFFRVGSGSNRKLRVGINLFVKELVMGSSGESLWRCSSKE